MIQDRPILVFVLCLVAVVLGAALFPAAGMDGTGVVGVDDSTGETPEPDGTGPGDDASEPADDTADPDERADEGTPPDDADDRSGTTDIQTDVPGDDELGPDDGDDATADDDDDAAVSDSLLLAIVALSGVLSAGLLVGRRVWSLTDPMLADDVTREDLPEGLLPRLKFRFRRLPQATMLATIETAGYASTIGSTVAGTGSAVVSGFGTAVGSLSGSAAAIQRPSLPPVAGLFDVTLRWPSVRSSARSNDRSTASNRRRTGRTRSNTAPVDDESGSEEPESVADAWERLVGSLSVRRPSIMTPRECARAAIDAGMPEDAVMELTETFELIRYGGVLETPDRSQRALSAYERIHDASGGGDQ